MSIQNYVINKDYSFNIENKRMSSEHGLIRCILSLEYYCNRDVDDNGFYKAWDYIKEAGWDVNYIKSDIEALYNDVAENTFFIDKSKVDLSKHVVAVL